jgi:hypothetical protein
MSSIDEINSMWSLDSNLDISKLDILSLNIPKLHNKYYKQYINEKNILVQLELKLTKLKDLKQDYYSNKLSDEELHKIGWERYLRILKPTEIESKVQSDKTVIELTIKYAQQKELVLYIESIIKQINQMSFNIKNAIEFLKFTNP